MNYAKSKQEHKEKGNYRPSRHENRIVDLAKPPEAIPKAPRHLDKRHREKWAQVCKSLIDLSILKTVDLDLVERYIQNWFISHDAWMEIQEKGITIESKIGRIKNPSITVMNDAQKVVIQIGSLFGFSPQARMRIKTEEKKVVDPFEAFLTNN